MRTLESVLKMLRERGHRMTGQRRAIVAAVMETEGHITPSALVRRVRAEHPGVNESTVYRTLNLLEEVGVLSHAHLHGGPEYHHADAHDHAHLACSNCGKDLYLRVDDTAEMRKSLERKTGFHADFTHFAIAGLCAECADVQGRAKDGSKP